MIERELKYDPLERSGQIEIHAWLLLWSWCFLIPVGTLIWTHTKRHRDLQPHPAIHVISSGLLGIVLALVGFGYGINKFSTFSRPGVSSFRMAHAVIGTIATTGMLFQILTLAFMRPASVGRTPVGPGYVKAGHYAHRYLGFLWMFMGVVACEMGTHISSVTSEKYLHLGLDHENEKYAGGLIAALTATAFVTASIVFLYDASATAVAPEPYHGTKSQEQEIAGGGGDVETPPEEAFEIGDLEMEDIALSQ